jgi:integrase
MKGRIYPTRYGYQVRFGRNLTKHFKTLQQAEKFLTGIRFKTDEGSFDIRDYKRGHPLGFTTLAEKWIEHKRQTVKHQTLINLMGEIRRAEAYFQQTNIKSIGSGDVEDFIFANHRTICGAPISSKTRHDIAATLHQFFRWVSRREKIPLPEFPQVTFELAFHRVVDLETQQRIISEVKRISEHINIKIFLGIKWLAENPNVRPGELTKITEGQILLDQGVILVRKTKEDPRNAKYIMLDPEDVGMLRTFPRALPEVPFFRHERRMGAVQGSKFGPSYLSRWWNRACWNIGIEGVTLYPGTKHSTVTALGALLTPEQIKRGGTGHATSAAFERYMLPDKRDKLVVRQALMQLKSNQPLINISARLKSHNDPK